MCQTAQSFLGAAFAGMPKQVEQGPFLDLADAFPGDALQLPYLFVCAIVDVFQQDAEISFPIFCCRILKIEYLLCSADVC